MSDSTRVSVNGAPVGDGTFANAARTCSLVTVMVVRLSVGANIGKAAIRSMWV
jgi:hypothetical protein